MHIFTTPFMILKPDQSIICIHMVDECMKIYAITAIIEKMVAREKYFSKKCTLKCVFCII